MKMRQSDFFKNHPELKPNRISHGGSKTKGVRKLSRPLVKNKPLHLILKSSAAKGRYSFLTAANRLFIEKTLRDRAQQFGITLHRFENMGNHIHVILKFKRREDFQNFLRTVTALIARFVTGAKRGKPFGQKFWDDLAFTRIITGFRDLLKVENYFNKNVVERELGQDARKTVEIFEDQHRKLWAKGRRWLKRQSTAAQET